MKKHIALLLLVCTTVVVQAQNFFAYLDNSTTQPLRDFNFKDIKDNYYDWQWLAVQFKNGTGVFAQASQEPTTNSLVAGVFTSKKFGNNDKNYLEFGISAGREWNKFDKDYCAISGYGWYENYPDEIRKKGKIMIQVSPYYSKATGYWIQGFALISPIKSISLGAYFQTAGTMGPRVQVNFPGVVSLWFTKDLSQLDTNPQMATIGLQFINLWDLKSKKAQKTNAFR
jgi:hypothetical protein